MLKNSVLDIWKEGKSVINGWLSIPHSFTAEAMAKMGWDSLTIDIQHGLNDFSTSISMLQAINNNSTVPFARVPWNEPGIIMKMLDAIDNNENLTIFGDGLESFDFITAEDCAKANIKAMQNMINPKVYILLLSRTSTNQPIVIANPLCHVLLKKRTHY